LAALKKAVMTQRVNWVLELPCIEVQPLRPFMKPAIRPSKGA
jgi:hypothetical protein